MKRTFIFLLSLMSVLALKAQSVCIADFEYQQISNNGSIYYEFTDRSFSYDSMATVTAWQWTFQNANISTSSLQNPGQIYFQGNAPTVVCLTITTSNGCTATTCDSIFPGPNCNISITGVVQDVTGDYVDDGAIDITVSGGTTPYQYFWSNGSTVEDLTMLSSDYYYVSVIDAQNCVGSASFYVAPYNPQNCTASFSWQNSQMTYSFSDLSSSGNPAVSVVSWYWTIENNNSILFSTTSQDFTYTFTQNGVVRVCLDIITSDSCYNRYCTFINVGDSMGCNLTAYPIVTPVSVIGGNDGSIELVISGSTPPYFVNWNNGQTGAIINNLSSGVYTANIYSIDSLCPAITVTASIYEPYDPNGGNIVDTLYTTPIDTCFGAPIDSFFISSISVNGAIVTVNWVFIGGGLTTTLTVSYTFTNAGNQAVVLTISCAGSKVLTSYMSYIHINTITSIESQESKGNIVLYPNPVTDFVTLSLELEKSCSPTISIFDINGSRVIYQTTTCSPGINQISINTSLLPQGVYFMKAVVGNKIITEKFIK